MRYRTYLFGPNTAFFLDARRRLC